MGGKEAILKLREIDPDVRVIVSSGYSEDALMSDYKNMVSLLSLPNHTSWRNSARRSKRL